LCQGQEGVDVSLALQSSSVTLHEPVVVNLSIHNDLAEEASIDLGYDREGNFEFSIVQPDGSTVRPPHLPRHNGISRIGKVRLRPAETYWQRLLLNKWYPFSIVGNYRVVLTLATAVGKNSGPLAKAEFSQQLTLEVGERDEKRLESVCEGLTRAAMLTNADTALDAAKSLSYVEDVVAVPYLARLTRQGPFVVVTKYIALQGLGRVARVQSVETVVSRLSPEDRKLEPEIRAAAWQPSSGTQNPHSALGLRERARKFRGPAPTWELRLTSGFRAPCINQESPIPEGRGFHGVVHKASFPVGAKPRVSSAGFGMMRWSNGYSQ
jgi:hypothetical protein